MARTLRRLSALLDILVLPAAFLAACGDDEDETSEASASASASASEAPAEGGAAEAPETVSEGTLTVCSDTPYEPFEFEEDGEDVGYDIDLLRAVAEDGGLELEVKDLPFDGILGLRRDQILPEIYRRVDELRHVTVLLVTAAESSRSARPLPPEQVIGSGDPPPPLPAARDRGHAAAESAADADAAGSFQPAGPRLPPEALAKTWTTNPPRPADHFRVQRWIPVEPRGEGCYRRR